MKDHVQRIGSELRINIWTLAAAALVALLLDLIQVPSALLVIAIGAVILGYVLNEFRQEQPPARNNPYGEPSYDSNTHWPSGDADEFDDLEFDPAHHFGGPGTGRGG